MFCAPATCVAGAFYFVRTRTVSKHEKLLVAVDLGAGFGAKLGFFHDPQSCFAEAVLPLSELDCHYDALIDGLVDRIAMTLSANGYALPQASALGLSSPGIFGHDGSYLVTSGFDYLDGRNLRDDLAARLPFPVAIENDANAGALAVWNLARCELLYWVLGGGWGGAWVSADGQILHPAVDWDGVDSTLHLTNEPGFATPLLKSEIAQVFKKHEIDFDLYCERLREELSVDEVTGPGGNPDVLRAEMICSGKGIYRIFMTRIRGVIEKYPQIDDPGTAGRHIDELALAGDENAAATYRLLGEVFAMAGEKVIRAAGADGAGQGIPVYIGGNPSRALPWFGPPMQARLLTRNITSYMRPSMLHEQGLNANLIGAAVLAEMLITQQI